MDSQQENRRRLLAPQNSDGRPYALTVHHCAGCDTHVPIAHGVVREVARPDCTFDVHYCVDCWYVADHADPKNGSFGAAATELVTDRRPVVDEICGGCEESDLLVGRLKGVTLLTAGGWRHAKFCAECLAVVIKAGRMGVAEEHGIVEVRDGDEVLVGAAA